MIGLKVEYWRNERLEWGIIFNENDKYYYIYFEGNKEIQDMILKKYIVE
jgi:hypothetical protein